MSNNFALIKQQVQSPQIKQMVNDRLGEKSGAFISSVLDLIGSEKSLMACDPMLVIKEAMKAAALDLPISKQLGFAYIIPYNQYNPATSQKTPIPSFQMGYKGYIQLALRTNLYKYINAGPIYEGEHVSVDRIRGIITITGEQVSEKEIGYFAYMQLLNGFEKAVFATKETIEKHRDKFAKGFNKKDSAWQTDFGGMGTKTMILKLIPKYGPMSVDMAKAIESERDTTSLENDFENELEFKANRQTIDIKPESIQHSELTEEEKAEIEAAEMAEYEQQKEDGPGF